MEVTKQFIRYAVVGVASNTAIYLLYLLVTWLGIGPKIAMTSLYIVGVLQTFVLNRKWSFGFSGRTTPALARYATAYVLGYVVNLIALVLLVDQLGLPHQLVQGVMILMVALMLFLAQRYWVFPTAPKSDPA